MKRHEFIGSTTKKRFCVHGVDLFKYPWDTVGDVAVVFNPITKKTYSFSVYQIMVGQNQIQFIAGKRNDGGWDFYTYD